MSCGFSLLMKFHNVSFVNRQPFVNRHTKICLSLHSLTITLVCLLLLLMLLLFFNLRLMRLLNPHCSLANLQNVNISKFINGIYELRNIEKKNLQRVNKFEYKLIQLRVKCEVLVLVLLKRLQQYHIQRYGVKLDSINHRIRDTS